MHDPLGAGRAGQDPAPPEWDTNAPSDRSERVGQLLEAALERPSADRAAFLAGACSGNDVLRREIESLLSAHDKAGMFLATRARDLLPQQNDEAAADPRLPSGMRLGPYEVVARIGAGGMGEVYRARDTRLDRDVALKVLNRELAARPRTRERFEREARAVSRLTHPHICSLYDVGSASSAEGEVPFLVMELVDGETLAARLARGPMPVPEAITVASQIADALAAAHAAGIVHRDLKPANIMLARTGAARAAAHVRLLDFGLARLREATGGPAAQLQPETLTTGAALVGTLPYMAPEQVRGEPADARTDLFAFGAVFYEMLTGRRAFAEGSQAELTVAILERMPPPPSTLQPNVPEALDRFTHACLAKDPADRWQSAQEVVLQLKAIEALQALEAFGVNRLRLPGRLRMHWRRARFNGSAATVTLGLMSAAVLLLVVAGFTSWLWRSTDSPQVPGRAEAVLTPITADSGLSFDPALSPDGKLLAYASDRSGEGHLDIWVQQVGGGEPVRLTRHEADDHSPSFSPDGTLIAFVSERRGHGGGLYVMPALSGEARLVAARGVRPRFSPDGAWIAYSEGSKTFVVPAGGGPPQQLAPEFLDAHLPVWFPDGTRLLFAGNRDAPGRYTDDWFIAPLDGGPVRGIGALDHLVRYGLSGPFGHPLVGIRPEVSPRGDAVIFSATHGASTNLWQIRLAADTGQLSGPPEQLTFLASGAGLSLQPSVARSGDVLRLAFWNVAANMDVWSLALDHTDRTALGPPVRLTRNAAVEQWPSLSGDGKRMTYNVRTRENWDVWLMDLETGRQAPLAAGPTHEMWPKITRDGRTVAYAVEGAGTQEIHALTIGSAIPEKLCEECTEPWDWSSDGQYLLYRTGAPRQVGVLRRGSSGTVVLAHPDSNLHVPRFSPDDRWILFTALSDPRTGGEGSAVFVAPFRGDAAIPAAEWQVVAEGLAYNGAAGWSHDGNLVYFMSRRDGFRCLWAQRLHPTTRRPEGEPFEVQPFHRPQIRSMALWEPGSAGMAVARDRIVFSMVEATGNIWMAEVR